jgi:lysyl-tRNA synthetase, class II
MNDPKDPNPPAEPAAVAQRRAKLGRMREEGNPYPNDFVRTQMVHPVTVKFRDVPAEEIANRQFALSVGGRLMSKRNDGDIAFGMVEDASGRIQFAVSAEASGKAGHAAFAQWDPGDIVGIEGILYKTANDELTIRAHSLRLIAKCLRSADDQATDGDGEPSMDRPRYVQMIVDPQTRRRIALRSRILQAIRAVFNSTQYVEVESPLLQAVPGVEAEKTFATHHNALDMSLYLRRSALPYLARLAVGGMEKIYEINRSFRNDGQFAELGIEPTVMDIYNAYSSYDYMMALLELVIARAAKSAAGQTAVQTRGQDVDLAKPFARISLGEAIRRHAPAQWGEPRLREREFLAGQLLERGIAHEAGASCSDLQVTLFRALVAPQLIQPAFVIDFPFDRSTLARRSVRDPDLAEYFELYIGGRVVAHGASVNNDPAELEGRVADPEFIRAVEYGLPPASSAALAVDALTMLLAEAESLRDVVVFPGAQR